MAMNELNYRLIWNTRKEMVLAVLLLVISAMVLWLGILMQIAPIQKDLSQLNKAKGELEKFSTKANQLTQIVLDQSFKRSSEIDQVLPSHKPLLELLSNLNNVATISQVIVRNFSLRPGDISENAQVKTTSQKQEYNYLDLTFSVSGELGKVQDFLNLIEQVSPISTITSIAINRNIDEDRNSLAQAELVLRSFYFTQPIKTTIANPLPDLNQVDRRIISEVNRLRPNDLQQQVDVISGDRGNLFGLQNQTIEAIERQLIEQSNQETRQENQEENN
jgi:Tfp pilus assembly protein PilO